MVIGDLANEVSHVIDDPFFQLIRVVLKKGIDSSCLINDSANKTLIIFRDE